MQESAEKLGWLVCVCAGLMEGCWASRFLGKGTFFCVGRLFVKTGVLRRELLYFLGANGGVFLEVWLRWFVSDFREEVASRLVQACVRFDCAGASRRRYVRM